MHCCQKRWQVSPCKLGLARVRIWRRELASRTMIENWKGWWSWIYVYIYIIWFIYKHIYVHVLQEVQVPDSWDTLGFTSSFWFCVLARLAIGASVRRWWRPPLFTWFFGWWWFIPVERNCWPKLDGKSKLLKSLFDYKVMIWWLVVQEWFANLFSRCPTNKMLHCHWLPMHRIWVTNMRFISYNQVELRAMRFLFALPAIFHRCCM